MRIAARAAKDMVSYGAQFGLSPASRARVGGGVARAAASKFD
jgi:phage terminase small subunit